jgi:hypothetical protein
MALNIGKGTYAVYYNYQEVEGIESVDFQTDTETVDITTIKGEKVTFEKNHSAAVELTFVDTGIENLKKIVGDAWLDDGDRPGQPAGNVVNNDDGAIPPPPAQSRWRCQLRCSSCRPLFGRSHDPMFDASRR